MLQKFKDFLLRGNLVELAVAFVLGGAFGQVVSSLVSDVVMPLIGALGGVPDFSAIRLGPIALGKFINAVVNFLIVAAAIYFLVVTPMDELTKRRKKEEAPAAPPEPPEEVRLLREILEELRKKA
jgi:large conductance mechanosensitive channel